MSGEITIQCKLIRKGGTVVELNGTTYHFAPNAEGDHVCVVSDPDDIATLLGIKEGYRIYRPASVAPPAPPAPPAAPKVAVPEGAKPAAKAKPKKVEAAAVPEGAKPMGLPAGDKIEDLATLGRDEIAAIFEATLGRAPSEHAEIEVMIAQIEAKRAEAA